MRSAGKKLTIGSLMIRIAAALFCLVLISTSMMSGLYAKFISRGSGSDEARVIKFGDIVLTETGDFTADNKLMIIPGVDLTKKATVSFEGSESATYVFVEITPSSHWKTTDNRTFSITIDSKNVMQFSISSDWGYVSTGDGSYVYYVELIPNKPLPATDIIANNGKITVSNKITVSDVKLMEGISIKIGATVVQAGGFDDVKDAWTSVSD